MKKISLLAASVAVALAGCGSDSGSSSGGSAGGTITAFDGYFKNALVFVDKSNYGVWDAGERIIGLTDAKGQVPLDDITLANDEFFAVQTLVPGEPAQQALAQVDPEKYAGVYTVDMDLAGQPMEHEVVFRAPSSSDVISPITDLVAINTPLNPTPEEIAAAEASVMASLDITDADDLYSDFVAEADAGDTDAAVLHKTAQILTETKADPNVDYDNIATDVAKDAKDLADSIASDKDLDINDPSLVVPVDGSGTLPTPEYKTTVNAEVFELVEEAVSQLNDLEVGYTGVSADLIKVDTTNLFEDKDVDVIDYTQLELNTDSQSYILDSEGNTFGIKAYFMENELHLGPTTGLELTRAGKFELLISVNAPTTDNQIDAISAIFEFEIGAGEATAPELDEDVVEALQDSVDAWEEQLIVGSHKFFELNYLGLFESDDIETISVSSNLVINGFVLGADAGVETSILLSGAPLRSSEDDDTDYSIKITATNTAGLTTTVELEVPEIAPEVNEEFPGIKPIEDFDNQEECEQNGGYWYDNSCHADPEPTDPDPVDPVDPVDPTLGFTQAHFTKGGNWHMGSFDYGDAEIGNASLRVNNGENEICFASDDPDGNNTLTRNPWRLTLGNLDEGTSPITDNDCGPAVINEDGTLSLLEDGEDGAEEMTLTMLYQNITSGTDYQIIMKSSEGELFWLDSTQQAFNTFSSAMAKDGYTEHFLFDDHTDGWKIEPLVDVLTYTETARTPSPTIIAEGTYDAYSLTEQGATWTGNWNITEEVQGMGQVTVLSEADNDITRERHAYRDFGDIQIGIGDSDKDDALGDNGFFYITSDDQAIIEGIYNAWANVVPALDPTPLLNKDMFLIETPEDGDESTLNVCLSYRLEGDEQSGTVYFNAEEPVGVDLTKACAPATVEGGTYTIDNNIVTIDEPGYTMTFKLLDVQDDNGSLRTVIHTTEKSDDEEDLYYSAFESYESQDAAEARIATETGADDWDNLSQLTTMWIDDKFVQVYVTPQATNTPNEREANDAADADVFFDRVDGDITCYDLRNNFDYVSFDGVIHQSLWNDCYDDNVDEETGYRYVTVDLDFNTDIEQGSHAIHFSSANGHEVQSINRNIVFKNDSSYD